MKIEEALEVTGSLHTQLLNRKEFGYAAALDRIREELIHLTQRKRRKQ